MDRPPNPLFGNFSFSNYLADSQSTPNAFTQYLSQQSQNLSQQSQNQQPQKKKGPEKERNPNWSKQEDEALCKAWLRISEDAATGTDQSRATLWDRIWNEFNCILGYQTERTSTHLMNRWTAIQSRLNKYSGFVRTVERTPTSGYNVEDSIGAVDALYYNSEGHHFKFHGCWMLLKDSSKWFNYSQEKEKRKEKTTERKRHEGDGNVDSPSTPATPTSAAVWKSMQGRQYERRFVTGTVWKSSARKVLDFFFFVTGGGEILAKERRFVWQNDWRW